MEFGIRHKPSFPSASDPAGSRKCSCYSALKTSGRCTSCGALKLDKWDICKDQSHKWTAPTCEYICLRCSCSTDRSPSECAQTPVRATQGIHVQRIVGKQIFNLWKSFCLWTETFSQSSLPCVLSGPHSREVTSERTARATKCSSWPFLWEKCSNFCS